MACSFTDFAPRLFELRSYRAQPGRRDELIGMFEDVFLDAYQAGGARIVGTFRSLDEPDRWVWMRAFADAASRGPALEQFYGGSVWRRRAAACNALIADVSEALLLREAAPGDLGSRSAPPPGASPPDCVYTVSVYPLARDAEDGFAALMDREPKLVAIFVSDHGANSFPRQAVRAGSVGVTFRRFASAAAAAIAPDPGPSNRLAPPEVLRLAPSARSALR